MVSSRGRFRWPRLGLRARIALSFALGGLLISSLLAGATLILTRDQLLEDRESAAVVVIYSNATRFKNQLEQTTVAEDVPAILDSLSDIEGSQRLVRLRGEWIPGAQFGPNDLPAALEARVDAGQPGEMRAEIRGRAQYLIGIPVDDLGAQYFEAVDLEPIEDTLRSLGLILLFVGAGTTALGAGLGWFASRRSLLPLRRVRSAAEAIAGGRLDTRLEPPADRDLASLTLSFNEMAGALQERVERDSRFASEVSHELRSPLMTLMTSAAVIEARREELSVPGRTALDLLTSDLDRFSRLVEDLLEISRFDAGAASLELSSINLTELVQASINNHADDRSIEIVQVGDDPVTIMADKRRLAQVLANLLENARKYGGGATRIEIERTAEGAQLAIEDNGPGVSEEERAVIFDRFSRGGAGGSRGDDSGTGLGLALVQEHVALHDGQIWVEASRNSPTGARFVVSLPQREMVAQ